MSVPVDPTVKFTKNKLKQDWNSQHRTSMTVRHTITLLESGDLPEKHFTCQGKVFEEIEEASWAHPEALVWPTSTWRTLRPGPSVQQRTFPRICRMYVDDTFVVQENIQQRNVLHMKSINPCIQFTVE